MNTIPREATIVANCNIWAFSSIMTRPLAILTQIVLADKIKTKGNVNLCPWGTNLKTKHRNFFLGTVHSLY